MIRDEGDKFEETHVNMNPDLDDWDPMLEDFTSGKKYEEGPGADLVRETERSDNEEERKILLKNIPQNINVEGIRNLCLSAGIPTSVIITRSNNYAVVTFKTTREAELAIRDLNNTPPYFLRAKFAVNQGDNKKDGCDESLQGVAPVEHLSVDSFYKCPPTDKRHLTGKLTGKKTITVSPYFSICCEHDDPSLMMRLKDLDFKTKKLCVSMGRGYINMGDEDRFKCETRIFSIKSDNWSDNDCETAHCNNCGATTYKNSEVNYCSNLCETEAKSMILTNSKSTIFDLFTPGASGLLYSLKEGQDGLLKCCVVLDKELDRYKQMMKDIRNVGEVRRAEKGDRVIARNSKGDFFRGIVMSDGGDLYSVALFDYGETISVENVYKLPSVLQDVPSFGGVARFSTDVIPDFEPVKFRVKERQAMGSWLCDVIDDNTDDICEVLLEEWSVPECLTCVPLESGCNIIITTFKDMKTVFVRRTDGSLNEDFVRLSNDVAAYSLNGKRYKKLPKLGEVCSARYKNDGCFYRAFVRSVRRNSVCVAFMDYGNEQETELDDLCYLPNAIRQVNCFAARVRLKSVPETSSPESVNYLNQLTAYGRELRLTCDNGEVVLIDETNGEVVNDVISDLVLPVWEKDSSVFIKSSETYFLDSVCELAFRPGEIEDIFVMNVDGTEFNTSGTFWGTRNRTDFLGHLNGELKQRMTEYCSCLADDPYLPRKGELCLVEFQGDWYRGVSLDDRVSPYKVFLIDFGILTSVETKEMRKILQEFLEMPALAVECRISGFESLDSEAREKISKYMMAMNKKLLKRANIVQKVDGVYEVSASFVQGLLG